MLILSLSDKKHGRHGWVLFLIGWSLKKIFSYDTTWSNETIFDRKHLVNLKSFIKFAHFVMEDKKHGHHGQNLLWNCFTKSNVYLTENIFGESFMELINNLGLYGPLNVFLIDSCQECDTGSAWWASSFINLILVVLKNLLVDTILKRFYYKSP